MRNGEATLCLAVNAKQHIVAGTSRGKLLVWDLNLTTINPEASVPAPIPTSRILNHNDSRPLHQILYDPFTMTCVSLTCATPETSLRRWDITKGASVNTFANGHSVELTTACWDREVTESLPPSPFTISTKRVSHVLLTGDVMGTICLWDIPEMITGSSDSVQPAIPTSSVLKPRQVISCAHLSPITELHFDSFKMVSAALDGNAKVWNLLTGKVIRTLTVRKVGRSGGTNVNSTQLLNGAAGNAAQTPIMTDDLWNRRAVRKLWTGRHEIIALVGDQVKSWNFHPIVTSAASRGYTPKFDTRNRQPSPSVLYNTTTAGATNGGAGGSGGWIYVPAPTPSSRRRSGGRASKLVYQFPNDLKGDIREGKEEVESEREYQERVSKLQFRSAGGISGLAGPDGLTEEELLSYAMMVSLEQYEKEAEFDPRMLDGEDGMSRSLPNLGVEFEGGGAGDRLSSSVGARAWDPFPLHDTGGSSSTSSTFGDDSPSSTYPMSSSSSEGFPAGSMDDLESTSGPSLSRTTRDRPSPTPDLLSKSPVLDTAWPSLGTPSTTTNPGPSAATSSPITMRQNSNPNQVEHMNSSISTTPKSMSYASIIKTPTPTNQNRVSAAAVGSGGGSSPSARTRRQEQRAYPSLSSSWGEEDELMYALELSKLEM
ncbi:hypothetical protein HK102_011403 [Quaeritorhiza haematococci]|nr:hypothetical protein HK102_011403 [Quaeritorhiza haematococci]